MSLRRNLYQFSAFSRPANLGVTPDLDSDALERWDPGVRAAAETARSDEAVIDILSPIGEDFWTGEGITAKKIGAALKAAGNKPVTVNINSPGGDAFEGSAIYTQLALHPGKVTIRVLGLAASAASVIAMAGDEIQISPMAFIMVHNTWIFAIGNRHDLRAAADFLEPFDKAMRDLFMSRTGADEKTVTAWLDSERWFTAKDAVEAKLADSILESTKVERDEERAKAMTTLRKVDAALQSSGHSRSERRQLLAELTRGKPGAVASETGKPGAADSDRAVLEALAQSLSVYRRN